MPSVYTALMLLDQISLLTAGGALALGLYFVPRLWRKPGGGSKELGRLILVCAANAAHPALTRLLHLPVTTSGQFFEPMEFLLPPLLWIYAVAAVRGRFSWGAAQGLHFVPFFVAVAASVLFTLGEREPVAVSIVFWAALSLQMVCYLGPALALFHRYQNGLADRVSNLARVDLGWLRQFFWVGVGLCLLSVIVLILLLHELRPVFLGVGVTFALAAAVWVLGSRGLEQRAAPEVPAERPVLPAGESRRIRDRLEELFLTEKPHLDPDLDLAQLAALAGVARNSLSYTINAEFGVNFYDLVNGWRLKEFSTLAAEPARRSDKLLTLALDSGFNSKPTFNKVVLKLTGKTPSLLRQEILGGGIVSQPSR